MAAFSPATKIPTAAANDNSPLTPVAPTTTDPSSTAQYRTCQLTHLPISVTRPASNLRELFIHNPRAHLENLSIVQISGFAPPQRHEPRQAASAHAIASSQYAATMRDLARGNLFSMEA